MLNHTSNICKLWAFPLRIIPFMHSDQYNYFKVHLSFKQIPLGENKCTYINSFSLS